MNTAASRSYRVIVSVTRDFVLDVDAGSPTQARELARAEFGSWSPIEEMCHVEGDDRIRVRLSKPASGRCPFTEEIWPDTVAACT